MEKIFTTDAPAAIGPYSQGMTFGNLVFSSGQIPVKTTRSTQGVQVMTLKKSYTVQEAKPLEETPIVNKSRYKARSLPAAGALLKAEDQGDTQLSLL